MSGHTPGPWRALDFDTSPNGLGSVVASMGRTLADVHWAAVAIGVAVRDEDLPANARLIAAAPDLLAALEEIAKGEGAFSRDPLTHAENTIEAMQSIARAAITKAKGGA